MTFFALMSKNLRQHAPGCVLHITARTQNKEPWFVDSLKDRVEQEIMTSATMTGMMVMAHVVMPNHFHIVLRQGTQPLAHMMHRVMHRTAMMLKRAFDMDGHVFGDRYWSGICSTPAYVRRAIIYTHLNPPRGGLCRQPEGYDWSGHQHYLAPRTDWYVEGREEGLRFFAGTDGDDPLRQYLEHVRFQMAIDAYMRGELDADVIIPAPPCPGGNLHWQQNYQAVLHFAKRITPKQPLYDVACRLLGRLDPLCTLDLLRIGLKAPSHVRIRKNLIAALLTAGYRQTQIARLLCISTSSVSQVAISLRA